MELRENGLTTLAKHLKELAEAVRPIPRTVTITIKCHNVKWGDSAEVLAIKPKPQSIKVLGA